MINIEDIIINVLEAAICLWFIFKKFGDGHKASVTIILFVAFSLELTVATYFHLPTVIKVIVSIFMLLVYSIALASGKFLRKIFFSTFAVLLLGAADLLAAVILSLITHASLADLTATRLLRMQGALASKVILFALFFILSRTKSSFDLKGPLWPLLYSIPLISTALLFLFIRYQITTHTESGTVVALTVGFVFISFAAIYLYDQLAVYTAKAFQEELMAQQIDAQQSYIMEMQRISEESRGLRHDMANHMQALHGMIDDQNYSEALAYVENIEAVQAKQRVKINTGYPAVDAIIGSKLAYAESIGITTEYHLSLPAKLKIPSMDFCAILGNLLDNAIEACQSVENEPLLQFSVAMPASQIVVSVENSWVPRADLFKSRKGPGHGIGLLNVRRIVEQRSGMFITETTEQTFKVRALIPN